MTNQGFKDGVYMWLFGGGELHTTPGLCELPVSLLSKEVGMSGVLNREVVLVCPVGDDVNHCTLSCQDKE